jgi:LSD1 subclass zinc finger protein
MLMLVNCSNCRRALQLPPGAHSIRCAICHAVTRIADPRSLPPPPPPPHSHYPPPQPPPFTAPSPYNHAPPGPPPSVHGRKRAVICGISYKFSRHELKGCVNDAKCMKYLLVNKFNFPESSILMLTGTLFLISIISALPLIICLSYCFLDFERERERESKGKGKVAPHFFFFLVIVLFGFHSLLVSFFLFTQLLLLFYLILISF